MKRIALLSVPDPRFPHPSDPGYEANRVDYRLLIENAVRVPLNRETGASIEEMRKGVRILDALDRARDDVLHGCRPRPYAYGWGGQLGSSSRRWSRRSRSS